MASRKSEIYDYPIGVKANNGEVRIGFGNEFIAMTPETARLLAASLVRCAEQTATMVVRKESYRG